MTYTLTRELRGYQPVYVCGDSVILFRRDKLYRAQLDLSQPRFLCALPRRYPLLGRFGPRLLHRILRTGVNAAAMTDDDTLYIVRRDQIFRITLSTGACALDFTIPDGRRALNLALVRDPAGGAPVLAFGEYFNNPPKAPVRIWRRAARADGGWEVAATFAQGEIDHVHAICQDQAGDVRVLTGDFGEAAAIWTSTADLSVLEPLMRGSQAMRACWLRQLEDGAFYFATDSQFETNYLRRFDPAGGGENIAPIEGSSIYSAQNGREIFFSSTVEPGDGSGSFVRDMFEREPGPGIASANAVIYSLSAERLTEVLRAPKDAWPMRLAQFGTFLFPQGEMPANRFYAFGNAVRRYDGSALCFERAA